MGPTTEIRWGERMAVDLPVRVTPRGEKPVAGRMRNISISGALIETDSRLALRSAVNIAVTLPVEGGVNRELEAVVVRMADGAIGIEWRDMACQPLMDLLHQPRRG